MFMMSSQFGRLLPIQTFAIPPAQMRYGKWYEYKKQNKKTHQKKPKKKKHVDTANIMDRFLAGLPHKRDTGDEALPNMNFGPNQAKDKKI